MINEKRDILNNEVSWGEIETELLRLDQYNFYIGFSNYKGPQATELQLMKERINKPINVKRTIISDLKVLSHMDLIMPSDIDEKFYTDLNEQIIGGLQQAHIQ